MKLYVPLIVFGLLQQVSLIEAAVAEDENNMAESRSGLRGGADFEEFELPEDASEESDRELRPFGYPIPRRRPGQFYRYGVDSPVGFRSYTSWMREPLPPKKFGKAGGKAGKGSKGYYGNRGRARGPRGGAGAPIVNRDGSFVVGIPRNSGSLAQALGFFRAPPNTPIVFVEQNPDNTVIVDDDDNVGVLPTESPTISPQPTRSPTKSPTGQPSRRPTPGPTTPPTRRPTGTPTLRPTPGPTGRPSPRPTPNPTPRPTPRPTPNPTPSPTRRPTEPPTRNPTPQPTNPPTSSF